MSYIVLARKWRPQNFDDLAGQETFTRTIKNALSHQKVPHAFLFSGPRGVGKTSAARILAKVLNCEQGSATESCGTCQNCTAITRGASVDVFEIDGASNNSVDDIRELRESVKYAPSGGKYKIYIIDEVHMLSMPAFNALLKTLEEPPPHVIFIFATTEPKKVPSTILSRCHHHAFRKISKTKIKERLHKISEVEKINISDTALEMIVRAADGSMRDALTLLDQASSFSDDITAQELQILMGLPETDIINSISETILSGDIPKTLSILKELTEKGYDLRALIKELLEHFRNIAVVKIIQKPEEFLEFSDDEIGNLQRQASHVTIEELTMLLTELFKLEGDIKSATNPRYALELGLLRTSFIKGMTSIGDLIQKLNRPDHHATSSVQEPEKKDSLKKEKLSGGTPNTEIQYVKERWPEVIERLKAKDPLLACKLAEARIIERKDKILTMGFNGGMSVLMDSVKKNSLLVESIIEEILGNQVKLNITSLPEEKKNVNAIKKMVFSSPFVKSAMELFNGMLLEVKSLQKDDKTDEETRLRR
jgi:DNA polymerase-3 subunit gamma/tau